jgi:hypothetical protein
MRRIAIALGLFGMLSVAFTIPETVVLMPTANRGTPRSLFLATEQYGAPRAYGQTYTRCLYTQWMFTERFEMGVDCIGFDRAESRQWLFNARFVLTPETVRAPGVACGAWNIGEGASPQYYLVGTRTSSFGRLHGGVFYQANRWGWGVGAQFQLPMGLDMGCEYLRLPSGDGYTSLGIGRALSDSVYLYTYYSRHHTTHDADLLGVYFSFTPFRLF